jgi:hypothetical protein
VVDVDAVVVVPMVALGGALVAVTEVAVGAGEGSTPSPEQPRSTVTCARRRAPRRRRRRCRQRPPTRRPSSRRTRSTASTVAATGSAATGSASPTRRRQLDRRVEAHSSCAARSSAAVRSDSRQVIAVSVAPLRDGLYIFRRAEFGRQTAACDRGTSRNRRSDGGDGGPTHNRTSLSDRARRVPQRHHLRFSVVPSTRPSTHRDRS